MSAAATIIDFHTHLDDRWFDRPLMDPATFRRAAAAGLPVLFHDGTPPYATTFQIAAAARWVPEATVVLGHAGLADYCLAAGQLVRDIPNLYACVCGPRAGDVRYLVDVA